MLPHDSVEQRSWWKLVLLGLLAIAFGVAVIVLPPSILTTRIVDAIFGLAKPLSASLTAVAAFLALVALVAIDALINLLGTGVMGKRASRIRGVIGIAVAIAAIFWPDWTVVAAVELIGIWAILIGVLELFSAKYSSQDARERALFIIAAIAAIALGIGMMKEIFVGAVLINAVVGIAAAARGISLIVLGVSRRVRPDDMREGHAVERDGFGRAHLTSQVGGRQ